ncbi:MAG TPA: hypothetical protein GX529_03780 [Firmicutes bacterium]|nr:hypothetical protein [Candidatus Fermentithermobacillaceae bacterium]
MRKSRHVHEKAPAKETGASDKYIRRKPTAIAWIVPRSVPRILIFGILLCLAVTNTVIPMQHIKAQAATGKHTQQKVTLNFVGDILLASRIQELINAEGPMAPWIGVKDTLQSADFTIGNLECAVGSTGSPMPGKQYTFRAPPETLQGLKDAGVDIVSLANNHTRDFGVDCLLETIGNVKTFGVTPVGAGQDEIAARAPVILEKNGIKVGLLATSMVIPVQEWAAAGDKPGLAVDYSLWNHNIVSRLQGLRTQVDFTVVYLHWGEERATAPEDWVLQMESILREAGADIIVGTHPHVLRGFRFDGKALTAHSLGNFIFTTRPEIPACQIGAVLSITLSKTAIEDVTVLPTKILWGKTVMLEDKEREDVLAMLNNLSQPFNTDISDSGKVLERAFPDVLNHWARLDIAKLARKNIVEGFKDGSFLPDKPVTRAEFVTTLARVISGKPDLDSTDFEGLDPGEFCLCEESHWAFPYVAYLAHLSILPHYDPQWIPDEFCPREEVCTLLWRTATTNTDTGTTGNGNGITGTERPKHHDELEPLEGQNRTAVLWCIEQALLQGYDDGTLRLNNSITRAEAAAIILRLVNLGW